MDYGTVNYQNPYPNPANWNLMYENPYQNPTNLNQLYPNPTNWNLLYQYPYQNPTTNWMNYRAANYQTPTSNWNDQQQLYRNPYAIPTNWSEQQPQHQQPGTNLKKRAHPSSYEDDYDEEDDDDGDGDNGDGDEDDDEDDEEERPTKRPFQPFFYDSRKVLEHVIEELRVPLDVLKAAARVVCEGDVEEFVNLLSLHALGLSKLLYLYPEEFNFFLHKQVPYWLGKVKLNHSSVNVVEEGYTKNCLYSSIVTLSYLNGVADSSNQLRLFSYDDKDGKPSLALSKTVSLPGPAKFPACVKLGSFVYFMGGQCKLDDDVVYSSKKMVALNISDFKGEPQCRFNELPNMNVGKSTPLALAANGKIYVLSLMMDDNSKAKLSEFKFEFDFVDCDWTLVGDRSDWFSGAFEVYDPSTSGWTVLPLPNNPHGRVFRTQLPDYSSMLDMSRTVGYAVVRDRLFFYSFYTHACVHSFDTKTLCWNYYDARKRGTVEVKDYYDSLAFAIVDNGMYGQGLVVNDTLYAFPSRREPMEKAHANAAEIRAYHIPQHLNVKCCHSGPVTGFRVERILSAPASMPLQASVVYLGNGTFGSIHSKRIRKASYADLPSEEDYVYIPPPVKHYFTTFTVREEEAGNDGERCWSANVLGADELSGLAGNKERFLECFSC